MLFIQTMPDRHRLRCIVSTREPDVRAPVTSRLLDVGPEQSSPTCCMKICVTREDTTDTSLAPSSFQVTDGEKASWIQEGLCELQ